MPVVAFVRPGLGPLPFVMFREMTEPELTDQTLLLSYYSTNEPPRTITFDRVALTMYGGHAGRPIYVERGYRVEWNTLSEHIRLGDELRSILAETPVDYRIEPHQVALPSGRAAHREATELARQRLTGPLASVYGDYLSESLAQAIDVLRPTPKIEEIKDVEYVATAVQAPERTAWQRLMSLDD